MAKPIEAPTFAIQKKEWSDFYNDLFSQVPKEDPEECFSFLEGKNQKLLLDYESFDKKIYFFKEISEAEYKENKNKNNKFSTCYIKNDSELYGFKGHLVRNRFFDKQNSYGFEKIDISFTKTNQGNTYYKVFTIEKLGPSEPWMNFSHISMDLFDKKNNDDLEIISEDLKSIIRHHLNDLNIKIYNFLLNTVEKNHVTDFKSIKKSIIKFIENDLFEEKNKIFNSINEDSVLKNKICNFLISKFFFVIKNNGTVHVYIKNMSINNGLVEDMNINNGLVEGDLVRLLDNESGRNFFLIQKK